jgi:hypothetical protein
MLDSLIVECSANDYVRSTLKGGAFSWFNASNISIITDLLYSTQCDDKEYIIHWYAMWVTNRLKPLCSIYYKDFQPELVKPSSILLLLSYFNFMKNLLLKYIFFMH